MRMSPQMNNNINQTLAFIRTVLISICTYMIISTYSKIDEALDIAKKNSYEIGTTNEKIKDVTHHITEHEGRIRNLEVHDGITLSQ
jgi:hypothetical protein